MIILKIKQLGQLISIPGIPECRSPVEIDISKLDIRIVMMNLNNNNIRDYEIISKEKPKKPKQIKTQLPPKINKNNSTSKRLEILERIIIDNLQLQTNDNKTREHILNRIDDLENTLIKNKINIKNKVNNKKESNYVYNNSNPEIDTFFIPEIDIENMKISSSDKFQEVKQEIDLEESVGILEEFMDNKK